MHKTLIKCTLITHLKNIINYSQNTYNFAGKLFNQIATCKPKSSKDRLEINVQICFSKIHHDC